MQGTYGDRLVLEQLRTVYGCISILVLVILSSTVVILYWYIQTSSLLTGHFLPHSDSSHEEDVGNTVLFEHSAADILMSRIRAAVSRHEAIHTAG